VGLKLEIEGIAVPGEAGRFILSIDRLSIEPGACIGIRGPSGAGKSTLLFAIAGLLPDARGVVRWGGTDLLAMGDAGRSAFRQAHVGMVFQDFLLFEELSATANATISDAWADRHLRNGIADRAKQSLERMGIAGGSDRKVHSFSGGERQRVAVARALSTDPDIILADEPTASLDRETANRLIDDLTRLTREAGKTLIAASHDHALHERMDGTIDLAHGRIASADAGGA
jgi:ABC-type lipoprotein export system ATPase subunit